MDYRQQIVEQLVLSFYRTSGHAKLHSDSEGAHLLTLRTLESKEPFGGRGNVCLIFDAEFAFEHPQWEMVDTSHPCLEVIRNHLSQDQNHDPRFAEAHLPIQLYSPTGNITVPGMQIIGNCKEINYRSQYYDVFVLTYKVISGADYLIPIVCAGEDGAVLDLLACELHKLKLLNGPPLNNQVKASNRQIVPILKKAREIIEHRVLEDANLQAIEAAVHLAKEKQRLLDGYNAEKNNIPPHKKLELAEALERHNRGLKDLEEKEKMVIRVSLFSILHVWLPQVYYTIIANGKNRHYEINKIYYDGGTNKTLFKTCPRCGNSRSFLLCDVGHHAACASSSCGEGLRCITCGFTFCMEHGGTCGGCSAPVCHDDSHRCEYGEHSNSTSFCPKCFKLSFENKPICHACSTTCVQCKREFPNHLVETCRICSDCICIHHDSNPDGANCAECGQCVCVQHGGNTHDNMWVCNDHAAMCSCCGQKYGKSKLVRCIDNSEELLCPKHQVLCVMCGNPVCTEHVKYTDKREPLCLNDRCVCIGCLEEGHTRTHRRDEVVACAKCEGIICKDHRDQCQICGRSNICKNHQTTLPACASCGKTTCGLDGCAIADHSCAKCKMSYCRKCVQNGICRTCANLKEVQFSDDILCLLNTLLSNSDVKIRKTADKILKSKRDCKFWSAKNQSYRLYSLQYHPGFFAKLIHAPVELQVTTGRNDLRPVQIVLEK